MINFLFVCTENYFKYLTIIIKSIKKTQKSKYSIYVYLINFKSKIITDILKNNNIYVEFITIDVSKIKNCKIINKKYKEKKIYIIKSPLACYSANIRINKINDLLKKGIDNILYIDVDSIVLYDLTFLHENMYDKDVGLFYLENEVKSGIIYVRNTEISRKFFVDVEHLLNKLGVFKWYSDQISLTNIYNQYNNDTNIKISQLDIKYLDWYFKDDSYIWTGKGDRKKKNNKYIIKYNYFESLK